LKGLAAPLPPSIRQESQVKGQRGSPTQGQRQCSRSAIYLLAFDPSADRRGWIGSSLELAYIRDAPVAAENPSAAMTPAEQAAQRLETPFSVRRRQRGGRNLVQVSSNACEMDALRDRIRSQSRAVAEHIAADPEAQAFLDDWATPEPLSP
jgi:hypothetical protein